MQREPIPRLPVFGWQALRGRRDAAVPCLLDLPGLHYTTSGRASILLALQALGVGQGDGVLVPTYHCPTMVAPAADLGAVPVFYPIDERGAPDLAWLSRQNLSHVRVMLAAHYFGLPQPMGDIRRWCTGHGISLIEDCAHALFGRSGERPIGAWGDIAIASLTKFLPVPEGGCLVMNSGARLPPLRDCGATTHLRAAVDILEVGALQQRLAGFNGLILGSLAALRRLSGRGAATATPATAKAQIKNSNSGGHSEALHGQTNNNADFSIDFDLAHRQLARPCRWVASAMPRERIVALRRRNYELLQQRLAGHNGLHPMLPLLTPYCAPYVFPLWVDHPDPGYAELRRLEMPVFRWDRLWPGVPQMPGDHGLRWSHHVLQLACHQDLTEADFERFIGALLRLYASPGRQSERQTTEALEQR